MHRLSPAIVRKMEQSAEALEARDIAIERTLELNASLEEADGDSDDCSSRIRQRSCRCSSFPRISAAIAESDIALDAVEKKIDRWFKNQRSRARLAKQLKKTRAPLLNS